MLQDLCVIMLTAGVTSLLFKLFKQPVVLGYIVAGLFAGPYVCGESWISNISSVDTWGQIGVLFLLFALGLEFSFKKLLQVGSTAIIATATIVIGMMSLGFTAGRLLGWDEMNSIFLGAMLCMSSTTIVFKALEDLGLSNRNFAKICFSILIVEDLFAVLLMVLLSSIAVKQSFEGAEMLGQLAKLVAYIVIWFVVGIAVIPSFLKKFKKHLNDETMTILSVGMCLGMVMLAVSAGFSSALGAFVMGSVLAETVEAERIEKLVKPIKDMFGAIFFVSVGMMINPQTLAQHWLPITIITVIVIVGQIVFASLGTLLSGQSLKVSMQTGFTLVQIGEFAFIIASLGQSLKVTESYLYPIVVAVSVITTFLTPYIIKMSTPAYEFVDSHMSNGVRLFIENYSKNRNSVSMEGNWKKLLKKVSQTLVIYSIILMFVNVTFFKFIFPLMTDTLSEIAPEWAIQLIGLGLLLTFSSPFIYIIATKHRKSQEARSIWSNGGFDKGWLVGLNLTRIIVCVAFVSYGITKIFDFTSAFIVGIAVLLVLSIMFSRRVKKRSSQLEDEFNRNLSAREVLMKGNSAMHQDFMESLQPYDLHIVDFTVPAKSDMCGKKLKSLGIRNNTGASIVRIIRGGMKINIPGGNESIYPGDRIVAAGSDEQIDKLQKMMDSVSQEHKDDEGSTVVTLEKFTLRDDCKLAGKTIAQSAIREEANCLVLGIEREARYIMNPDSSVEMKGGDTIIVAGEKKAIRLFVKSMA